MYFRIEDCIRFSFISSFVYVVAVLRTAHNVETIAWSLWWAFITVFARITANHKTLYKRAPDWWETWNTRLLFSSTAVAILYACGIPYAWVGCLFLRASSFKTLAFFGFIGWSVLMLAGVCDVEYWPPLLLALAMVKQWAEKERCEPVVYWARRSVVTALHQEIRWCIWCKAVFPHVLRTDVSVLAWLITALIMLHRWVMFIQPKKTFMFKNMPATHVPAPSIDTAIACTICKRVLQIDDEERVYEKRAAPTETKKTTKKKKQAPRRRNDKKMFTKPKMRQPGYVQQVQHPQPQQQMHYVQQQPAYTPQDAQAYAQQFGIETQPADEDVCDFI